MSELSIVDAEIVPSATEVRDSISRARTHLEAAADEIVWQVANRAWEPLGYASWDEMREAEYGGVAVIVPRADRPELVGRLRALGMTQQGVADTVGVSRETVKRELKGANVPFRAVDRDLKTANAGFTPAAPIVNARGQQRPATYAPRPAPEVVDAATGEVLDAPRERRRRPLPDAMGSAAFELSKAAARVERLGEDDRLPRNGGSIAPYLGEINRTLVVLGNTAARIFAAASSDPQAQEALAVHRQRLLEAIDLLQQVADGLPATQEG
ncbi:MAG: hypothetical protein M9891_02325 [Austwickia sp.]|nr:hypothetical protein [Actinomycetota bacterium]MCB1254960.1 hypothetical protein [Austwickia sp.]MCO5308127.1 hypothetical protein [Austwickia sp.]